MPPVFSPPAAAPRYSMVGDTYTVLLFGRQTNNTLALIHGVVQPGFGPPLHSHAREDELFYILSGEVTFTAGVGADAKTTLATAGSAIFLPRNQPHTFKNTGATPATMLVQVFPGGNFDAYVEKVAEPLPPGADALAACPPSAEHIARVLKHGAEFGITFHL